MDAADIRKEKKKKKKKDKDRDKDESMESSMKSGPDTSMDVDTSQDMSGLEVKEKKKKKKKDKDRDIEEVEVKEDVDVVKVKREPPPYEVLLQNISPIASPLAPEKLMKRIFKCIGKARGKKHMLRRGVAEVQRALRKGEKGIVVMAGDVYPIDIYSHIPVFCEQNDVEYVYVPSKLGLGFSMGTRRPTCLAMIKLDEDYKDSYEKIEKEIKTLPIIGMR